MNDAPKSFLVSVSGDHYVMHGYGSELEAARAWATTYASYDGGYVTVTELSPKSLDVTISRVVKVDYR